MPTPAVLPSSLEALFHATGPEGWPFVLLPLLGVPLTLVAAGLALGRAARPALVLAGLVVGLGASGILAARALEARGARAVLGSTPHAVLLREPNALVMLLNGLRELQAFPALGVLAGLPLVVGGVGAGALAFARKAGRP